MVVVSPTGYALPLDGDSLGEAVSGEGYQQTDQNNTVANATKSGVVSYTNAADDE